MKLELKRRSKRIQTRLLAKNRPQKRELKRIQTRLLAKNRPPQKRIARRISSKLSTVTITTERFALRFSTQHHRKVCTVLSATTERLVRFSQPPPKGLHGLIISERLRPVSSSPKGFARSHHLREASPGLHLRKASPGLIISGSQICIAIFPPASPM